MNKLPLQCCLIMVQTKDEKREKAREYYLKHSTEIKKRVRQYTLEHKEEINTKARKYWKENKEKRRIILRRYVLKNPDKVKESQKKYRYKNFKQMQKKRKYRDRQMKIEVFTHYSQGTPNCVCCNETIIEFLSLDHINNDGAKDRSKGLTGTNMYRYVKKTGYPKHFQVMCHNCNQSRGQTLDHLCPHQRL